MCGCVCGCVGGWVDADWLCVWAWCVYERVRARGLCAPVCACVHLCVDGRMGLWICVFAHACACGVGVPRDGSK